MKSRSRYSLRGVHGHFCEAMVADPWTFCAPTALRLGSCSLGVGRRLSRKPPRPELECERVPKESCSSDKPQGRGRGRVPGWTRCTCSASRASWPSSPGSSLTLAFCVSSRPRPLPPWPGRSRCRAEGRSSPLRWKAPVASAPDVTVASLSPGQTLRVSLDSCLFAYVRSARGVAPQF